MLHRFVDCVLDEPRRALLRRGREASIEPKAFDLLVHLIRNRDRVVSRDELAEALWRGVAVSESAVSKCVSRAREAIGDRDPSRRAIRTLHGRGFQFVAAVESAAAFCAQCTAALPAEDALCPACAPAGAPPPPVVAAMDGERRQVTILCCELVGAAVANAGTDDDETRSEIVRHYHLTCGEVVARYDGYVANAYGDDLVVYFGHPRAHEDDASRAVRAAREIIAAVRRMNDPRATDLLGAVGEARPTARIGIDTGPIVVRDVGSHGIAVGETATIAAGLRAVAEPGAVVVSGTTLRLARGTVAARALGERQLAAVDRPVAAYRVLEHSALLPALHVAGGRLTPFVGREVELETLMERWGQVRERAGQTLLISGEAGIGKSRLVHGLHLRLAEEDHAWLEGRCSPYTENTAFHPLSELLERAFGFTVDDTPADKNRKLEAALERGELPLPETVALFADFLALPPPQATAPLEMSPQVRRRRTIEATVSWILALAERHPVALVLEDLQWCDPSSLELLGELIAQTPTTAVMAVLTGRPDFAPPWPPRATVTPLPIHRFAHSTAATMIAAVASRHALPRSTVARILERADGIPLHLEELTRGVLEASTAAAGGPRPALEDVPIPATLQSSLLARLDQLGEAKPVAQLGATIGGQFSYELLQAVSDLDDASLRRHVAAIVETGLVYQRGWPPRASYVFKHALVQEAAHLSLLSRARRELHARIARVLVERFPEAAERTPEGVASHLEAGGLGAEAAPWWCRAGERALARAANHEAIAHFRRALAALEAMPASPDRDRQELDAQLGLAPALMAIQGWASAEVEAACRRARELCERLDLGERLLPALWGLWTVHFLRGELEVALGVAESVLAIARGAGEPRLRVMGHHAVGFTRFFRGELVEATRHAEHGIALYAPAQERAIVDNLQFSSTVALRSFLAAALWLRGRPEHALEELERAAALVGELAHPPSRAFFLSFRVYLHFYRGEVGRTREAAEEMLTLAEEEGFVLWAAVAGIYRGWARARQGDADGGIAEMQQGVATFRDTGSRLTLVQVMAALGEVLLAAGRRKEAGRAVDEGLAHAGRGQEHFFEAELHRLAGELATRDAPRATRCFERALSLARSQGARSLELRAATSLARLWQRRDRHREAHQLLADVYRSFGEGLETADLRSAAALLAELG